jgi:hypothetical protein
VVTIAARRPYPEPTRLRGEHARGT